MIQEHIIIVIAIVAYTVKSKQIKSEIVLTADDSGRVKELLNEINRLKSMAKQEAPKKETALEII